MIRLNLLQAIKGVGAWLPINQRMAILAKQNKVLIVVPVGGRHSWLRARSQILNRRYVRDFTDNDNGIIFRRFRK